MLGVPPENQKHRAIANSPDPRPSHQPQGEELIDVIQFYCFKALSGLTESFGSSTL